MIWRDSFALGIPVIDMQHKELFSRLDELVESTMKNNGAATMGEMVTFLEHYALEHFATEEALMEKTAYPELAEHRLMHQEFKKELAFIQHELNDTTSDHHIVTNLIGYLCDWLIGHVLEVDQHMGEYLQRFGDNLPQPQP